MNRAALDRDLRARVFRPRPGPERIGAEVEMLLLDAESNAPVPVCDPERRSSFPLLRQFGAGRGWRETVTPGGAPCFLLPGGGLISWEPGGQIEYSSPPYTSANALLMDLRKVIPPLQEWMTEQGVALLSIGVDPVNGLDATPLQLRTPRYAGMDAYFGTVGAAGARMMRQTASFQVNLDWGADPQLRWHVLNAMAPYLTALFANSPTYEGRPTGHQSFRAHCWRELDPQRTGLFCATTDPAGQYLEWALAAPAMLKPDDDGQYWSFGEWLDRGGAGLDDWYAHLSTLFPEVRPKGHLEVRSLDAIVPEWYAAPLALLGGVACHPPTLQAVADLLGEPDPDLLRRAGELGLSDPGVTSRARDLWELGLNGCAALGPDFLDPADLELARAFFAG